MAEAVLQVHPEAKIAIGPAIENGFYYDFDLGTDEQGKPRTFTPEELSDIERRMRQIVAGKHTVRLPRGRCRRGAPPVRTTSPINSSSSRGLARGGVDEYGNETSDRPVISTYRHDTFEDLCRGPHLEHTGQIPPDASFKLMSVAGAYWRGDEHNPMLQRVYGNRLAQSQAAGGIPPDARGGQEARSSQAGQRPRDLHIRR